MNWDSIQQLIRILLQLGAGFLVSKGVINGEDAVTAVGAAMSLAGIAWWAFWNNNRA
jgi:hypothetical protein